MEVKFKLLKKESKEPTQAHSSDAGYDLTATSIKETINYIEYGTGIALDIPVGYVGLLFPRSSISKTDMSLANSVGVVDALYHGEIRLRMRCTGDSTYSIGDRIGQIVFMKLPSINLVEAESFEVSEREDSGFGSSGV